MDYVMIIGIIAGIITTLSTLPQAIKIIRLKRTKDISLGMYILLFTGVSLWFVYGILINDIPLIFANAVGSVLSFLILIMKLKYG